MDHSNSKALRVPGQRRRLQWEHGSSICALLDHQGTYLYAVVTSSMDYPELYAFQLLVDLMGETSRCTPNCASEPKLNEKATVYPWNSFLLETMRDLVRKYEDPQAFDDFLRTCGSTAVVTSEAHADHGNQSQRAAQVCGAASARWRHILEDGNARVLPLYGSTVAHVRPWYEAVLARISSFYEGGIGFLSHTLQQHPDCVRHALKVLFLLILCLFTYLVTNIWVILLMTLCLVGCVLKQNSGRG